MKDPLRPITSFKVFLRSALVDFVVLGELKDEFYCGNGTGRIFLSAYNNSVKVENADQQNFSPFCLEINFKLKGIYDFICEIFQSEMKIGISPTFSTPFRTVAHKSQLSSECFAVST